MAPISEAPPQPKKMQSRVKLSNQADSDVGFIERDIKDMEQAGVFRGPQGAKELIATKEEVARQELIQKKATEGAAGGKITIEDMMHRPGKKLISRKMENDIADFPTSSGASLKVLDGQARRDKA